MSNTGKIIGGFFILAITGGLVFLGVQAYKLLNFCYKMSGYKFNGLFQGGSPTSNPFIADSASLNLTMKLVNPSSITLKFWGYFLAVSINGVRVANVSDNELITLPANDSTHIDIPININLKNAESLVKNQALLGYLANKQLDKVVINVKGSALLFRYSTPRGYRYITKDINLNVTLAEIQKSMNAPVDPSQPTC